MSDQPTPPEGDKPPSGYDTPTLIVAGLIFVGFCLLLYFLPTIMFIVGGENTVAAGVVIVLVLLLPFGGLWLRGRMRRRQNGK